MYNKKSVRIMIEHILQSYPQTRDNDERLAANVLHFFLKKRNIHTTELNAQQLLQMYAEGKLPTIDYITRVRRKLQEENPHIRGEMYKIRKGKSTKVKETINNKPINEVL